jgi:aryl-alcohol dehydrogenase-like predicted oxidoreductase
MGMSDFYGKRDDQGSLRTLHRALELGVNFFDTADMYGFGDNEILLSKFIAEAGRDRVVVATKFAIIRDRNDPTLRGISGKPEYVRKACEESLKRLKVDTIDLYYQHRVDPTTPIEETVGAMAELVKQGKVKAIGLSEASAQTIRRAHKVHPISALQTEYSLWSRDVEDEILPTCRELGIGFVAYSPLGRGFLTGQIKRFEDLDPTDVRRTSPRFQGENFKKNLEMVASVEALARKKGCTSSQLALAWVMAQGDFITPIPGTKQVRYLEQNVGSLDVKLTREDLDEINRVAPQGIASGLRYPEAVMKSVNR